MTLKKNKQRLLPNSEQWRRKLENFEGAGTKLLGLKGGGTPWPICLLPMENVTFLYFSYLFFIFLSIFLFLLGKLGGGHPPLKYLGVTSPPCFRRLWWRASIERIKRAWNGCQKWHSFLIRWLMRYSCDRAFILNIKALPHGRFKLWTENFSVVQILYQML